MLRSTPIIVLLQVARVDRTLGWHHIARQLTVMASSSSHSRAVVSLLLWLIVRVSSDWCVLWVVVVGEDTVAVLGGWGHHER